MAAIGLKRRSGPGRISTVPVQGPQIYGDDPQSESQTSFNKKYKGSHGRVTLPASTFYPGYVPDRCMGQRRSRPRQDDRMPPAVGGGTRENETMRPRCSGPRTLQQGTSPPETRAGYLIVDNRGRQAERGRSVDDFGEWIPVDYLVSK